ncbi:MAG: CHASE3 domain-containing protein [Propionivibrio sp.]
MTRLNLAQLHERFRRSVYFLPLAIFVAAFMVVISESAYQGAHDQLIDLVKMGRARLKLLGLVQRVTDAETSQRGYIITGRGEYMEPYHFAATETRASLGALRATYRELGLVNAEALTNQLQADVEEKLDELAQVLVVVEKGDLVTAREMILTGLGRAQMERIRTDARALFDLQNAKIEEGMSSVFDTLLLSRIGIAAMTVLSLLVLIMFMRQSRQLDKQRLEQEQFIIRERDHLEAEVRDRTAVLTELARHLQNVREDERSRLARDLHDELGALLTAAKLDVARLRPKLQSSAPELLERVAHLTNTLNAGIALKRRIIEDLHPFTLENLGLRKALEVLCREFTARLEIRLSLNLEPVSLSSNAQLTVFRIVQEALNNIAKYAGATHVEVGLHENGDLVHMSVRDDGKGFDPAQIGRATHGLTGMRFRVEAECGSLHIHSAPGRGTTLEAVLPRCEEEATAP